ncbi:MAG: PAS domain S-box protein [Hyphomicrobiaceae bacterium]|nr:PAS domain S-box protein [Hyphomicrobiaceae bacterium]
MPMLAALMGDARPALILGGDGTTLLGANVAGARRFGLNSLVDALGRPLALPTAIARHIAAQASATGETARTGLVSYRAGISTAVEPVETRGVTLADGSRAVLAQFAAAKAATGFSPADIEALLGGGLETFTREPEPVIAPVAAPVAPAAAPVAPRPVAVPVARNGVLDLDALIASSRGGLEANFSDASLFAFTPVATDEWSDTIVAATPAAAVAEVVAEPVEVVVETAAAGDTAPTGRVETIEAEVEGFGDDFADATTVAGESADEAPAEADTESVEPIETTVAPEEISAATLTTPAGIAAIAEVAPVVEEATETLDTSGADIAATVEAATDEAGEIAASVEATGGATVETVTAEIEPTVDAVPAAPIETEAAAAEAVAEAPDVATRGAASLATAVEPVEWPAEVIPSALVAQPGTATAKPAAIPSLFAGAAGIVAAAGVAGSAIASPAAVEAPAMAPAPAADADAREAVAAFGALHTHEAEADAAFDDHLGEAMIDVEMEDAEATHEPEPDEDYSVVVSDGDACDAGAATEVNTVGGEDAAVDAASTAIAPVAKVEPEAPAWRRAQPHRFVWQMNAETAFTLVGPELAEAVGASGEHLGGFRWTEVADALGIDRDGVIGEALKRNAPFSGKTVLWPVQGSDWRVPVDLAALPVFGRSRQFDGYRGFGVARTADATYVPDDGEDEGGPDDDGPRGSGPGGSGSRDRGPETGGGAGMIAAVTAAGAGAVGLLAAEAKAEPVEGEIAAETEVTASDTSVEAVASVADEAPTTTAAMDAAQPKTDDATVAAADEIALGTVAADDTSTFEQNREPAGTAVDEAQADAAMLAEAGAWDRDEPAPPAVAHDIDTSEAPVTVEIEPARAEALDASLESGDADPTLELAALGYDAEAATTDEVATVADAAGVDNGSAEEVGIEASKTDVAVAEPVHDAATELEGDFDAEAEELATEVAPLAAEAVLPAGEIMPQGKGGSLLNRFDTLTAAMTPFVRETAEAEPVAETAEVATTATVEPAGLIGAVDESAAEPAAVEATEAAPTAEAEEAAAPAVTDADKPDAAQAIVEAPSADIVFVEPAPRGPNQVLSVQGAKILPVRPKADAKIVTLPSVARRATETAGGLSGTERDAFRQIAKALGARIEGDDAARPSPASDGKGGGDGRSGGETKAALAAPAGETMVSEPVSRLDAPVEAKASPQPQHFIPEELIAAPSEAATREAALLEQLPLAVAVIKGDAISLANRAFLDLLGYADVAELEAAGGLDSLFAGPHALKAWGGDPSLKLVPALAKDGRVVPVEATLKKMGWNGSSALVLSLREPPKPAEPATPAPVAVYDDPEAHEPEALIAARSRVAELEAILDTATDGVIVLGADGRIEAVNRAGQALFGKDAEHMVARPLTDFLAPESHRSALDYLDGLARNGVASVLNDGREVIGIAHGGGMVPMFMTIGRLGGGAERAFCAVLRDITHFKKAEEDLTTAKHHAEQASLHKSDFLAKMSHEIRTPLNAIIGFSEVMMEERFGPVGNARYKDYLKDIHGSGTHIMSLVNDLLDLSKIEAGKMELKFEAVNVNDIVRESVALMQPQANRDRIIIRTSLPSSMPRVVADERSIRQIVLNLLSNAVKFTPAGGQVIASTQVEEGGQVALRIRDTGVGMNEEEVKSALQPFRRLHTSRIKASGTGLGLPLTKALTEANRASFVIRSTVNQGTLVEIVFPTNRVLMS